jgi:hypothetical protein
MEFYSATKKNEILSLAGKWMKLLNIILSEVSQAQKAKATCILVQPAEIGLILIMMNA